MTNPTETLAAVRDERDQVRQQAIEFAQGENFDPDDARFTELETRAAALDKQCEKLADLLKRQSAADQLDGLLARADQRRAGQQSVETRSLPPLVPSRDDLRAAAEAIESGQDRFRITLQTRAAVTLPNIGGAIAPLSGGIPSPRRLVAAVGLTAQPISARGASGPRYGLLGPLPPTAEGALKPEAADITDAEMVPQVFARWTDVTLQASMEAPLEDVSRWHAGGIALDEDAYIIGLLATEAGTPGAGTGNVDADIRTAAAVVEATVAAPADVVICNPADVGVITAISPTSGADLAGQIVTLGGARLYPSVSQPAGTVLVAALRAVGRYGVARPTAMINTVDPKHNVLTVLTELYAGFVVRQAGGVEAVTIVTTP